MKIIFEEKQSIIDMLTRLRVKNNHTNEKLNKRIDNTQNKVNRVSNDVLVNTSDISDNREGLTETFEATLTNTDDVAINRQAIEELYEMITTESEVK